MSETGAPPEPAQIPQAIERGRRPRAPQLIWLVPLMAAVIGGWLAIKAVWWDRGTTITIQFQSGEGIEAGKTRIKHKAVDVGIVRGVTLSPDSKSVVVTAEIDRRAADGFLVEDARYWVVRPRIAGGQVSGLSTLLAGSYIGSDPGKAENARRDFEGLETPPAVTSDQPGRQFKLRADELGSLDIGSPLYFRGIVVGRVVSTEVPPDGRSVTIGAFVEAPYDKYVNDDSRFWNASGVDLSLDASGVKLHTQSLVTLLLGGVAFEAPQDSNGSPRSNAGTEFRLWENRTEALRQREAIVETYRLVFDQSVRGLAVGAPVDFRGLGVGEVRGITLIHDQARSRFAIAVDIHFWPQRMRVEGREPPVQRMRRFVERGLRAQLRSANLITGQLYVALDFFPKAAKAAMDAQATPAEIPTISTGGLGELQESIGNIVKSLEKVPFDKIAGDVRSALGTLEATLKRADALLAQLSTDVAPELRATLQSARKTMSSAERMLSSDSPIQGDLRETLNEVSRAAESVRALADYLERHPESLIRGKPRGDDRK